jgi:16S rRNA (cytosine967-C5)-methyltransferase
VDAPCTGLGALRRRPEARWRRTPEDVASLTTLQEQLLDAALRLVRPGGVVAYVTCSPHPAETAAVVAGRQLIDARECFDGVGELGAGPTVQLWPHRHGTDAMFCALIRG